LNSLISFPDNYVDCRTGSSGLNHHTGSSVNNGHTGLNLLGQGGSSSSSALLTGAYSSLYTSTSAHPLPLQQVTSSLQYHHSTHLHHQGGGSGNTEVSSPPLSHYYDLIQHHMNHSGSQHMTTTIQPPKVECPSPPAGDLQGNRSPAMTSHSPGETALGTSPHIVTLGNNNNNKVVVMANVDNNMDRPTVVSMSS
jgi:hypothetical protein